MRHPDCCKDPDNCTLTYSQHLAGVGLAAAATPNRHKEDTLGALVREKRWDRDMSAYKRLRADGMQPPQIDGSALREKQGTNEYDITTRPITIDYADAS